MAKSPTSNSKNVPSFQGPRHRPKWFAASVCFLLGVWLLVVLLNYDPRQSVEFQVGGQSAWQHGKWVVQNLASPQPNLGGRWGAETIWWSLRLLGISTWGLPIFFIWFAWIAVRSARRLVLTRFVAMLVCLASVSSLAAMVQGVGPSDYFSHGLGGVIGQMIYAQGLRSTVGVVGAGLLLGTIYILTLTFIFTRNIGAEIESIMGSIHAWRARRAQRALERAEKRKKDKVARQKAEVAKIEAAKAAAIAAVKINRKDLVIPKTKEEIEQEAGAPRGSTSPMAPRGSAPPMTSRGSTPPMAPRGSTSPVTPGGSTPPVAPGRSTSPFAATSGSSNPVGAFPLGKLNIVRPEETKRARVVPAARSEANYQFPPLSLLRELSKSDAGATEDEHRQNAENLLRILSEFGVEVTLGEIHVGPVITRYEVVPAPGVRVEKIAGLDKNIALGMRAQSVRIIAPIPGKAAVGVEVPNQKRMEVGLREILESEDWDGAKAELPIALGKDVSGRPLISDLAKMPHLLIAGATGSGKSVCINAVIASILYHASPRDVRFLMIDPKIVELKLFNDLPHMLIPVVTEAKKVPAALKWLLREMESRYQIFAKAGVRNISSFNSRKRPPRQEAPAPSPDSQGTLEGVTPSGNVELPDHLHYIVVVIDELADLMMSAPAEIESSVARLAQLARATGIHIVIATQRPSVNIITGVIKANLPSRIAFQVASQVDSRTIIDTKGADSLIGRGDMLFSPPGTSRLVRAQGALVSDEEIHGVVEFLKRNGAPVYAQEVQADIDREAGEGGDEAGDEEEGELGDDGQLYQEALDVLKTTRRASTSMLQRRLRIGYNRAARIMELMEQKGIVGPENGAQPREIIADLEKL